MPYSKILTVKHTNIRGIEALFHIHPHPCAPFQLAQPHCHQERPEEFSSRAPTALSLTYNAHHISVAPTIKHHPWCMIPIGPALSSLALARIISPCGHPLLLTQYTIKNNPLRSELAHHLAQLLTLKNTFLLSSLGDFRGS